MPVPYIFKPPHYKVGPADPKGERLWLYFKLDKGISIIKGWDGTYTQAEYPSTDDFNNNAFIFLGGHEYVVSDDEATALTAAGFTDLTSDPDGIPEDTTPVFIPPPPPPPGPTDPSDYGLGGYGLGVYGD